MINNTIVINKQEEKNNKELVSLIKKYLKNKDIITKLEQENESISFELEKHNYKTIGVDSLDIKLTITPSKAVEKIDYDKTLEGVEDVKEYKKEKISLTWDDDKIKNSFKKVYYKTELSKPRLTWSVLKAKFK